MPPAIIVAVPANVDLEPNPIPSRWIIEGSPEACAKNLAVSEDGSSWVVAWSCTAGRFVWHYSVDETVHIISGEVFITDEKGSERRLGPGDMAFFPSGSSSTWYVPNAVRKLAVCRHSVPRLIGKLLPIWSRVATRVRRAMARGEKTFNPWPAV